MVWHLEKWERSHCIAKLQFQHICRSASVGDLVVLAIPFAQVQTVSPAPFAGKIIVDANNYYPERDGQIAALDLRETTTSEIVAGHFMQSSVVKAFNAILARDLERGGELLAPGKPRALPIAGDDSEAKRMVAGLHSDFGFDCLDAGPLAEGWRFERAKPAYCIPLDREGLANALAAALRDVELPHGSRRAREIERRGPFYLARDKRPASPNCPSVLPLTAHDPLAGVGTRHLGEFAFERRPR